MSTIYEFPAFVGSYGLNERTFFDPVWNFVDPYELTVYYRGRRAYLIQGHDHVPKWFEVRTASGAISERLSFAEHFQELTVSRADVITWLNKWAEPKMRRTEVCTFGHNWISAFTNKERLIYPQLLAWHVTNRRAEHRAFNKALDDNEGVLVLKEEGLSVLQQITGTARTVLALLTR